ncbi:MAG: hypothetical protein CME06_12495 [Gemmatimonadetes bacterium]|nr:hypothetical protein [Gemmatimonadota bacterium]
MDESARLLLFDIDGTLLHSHGVGTRSMLDAIAEVCGTEIDLNGYSMGGRTDPQIFRELLERSGGGDVGQEDLDRLAARYLELLEEKLRERVPVPKPGVLELLERLAGEGAAHVGLVTGNFEKGAALKLARMGIDHYFAVGAYGSDHADRDRLPAIAMERAAEHFGVRHAPERVTVIGDTPSDVRCARAAGVRALAVATGGYDSAALTEHRPDHLLEDLGDVERVVGILMR